MTPRQFFGGGSLGKSTQTAGTVINRLVPPRKNAVTRIDKVVATAAGTAHVLTFLRELGRTTTSAAAATSQAVINLAAQPQSGNNVAANDWLVWENSDGTYGFDLVASVSSLAITMTNNLTVAVNAGATVWFLGITTDTGVDGLAHPQLNVAASATTTFQGGPNALGGLMSSPFPGDGYAGTVKYTYSPILVQDNNATAAGTIEQVSYCYTDR